MRNTRPGRRTNVPRVDQLESRQLLSTTAMPVPGPVLAHPHPALPVHHAAIVEQVHSSHQETAIPAAAPATSTGFQVVGQLNADFQATAAIADNDVWAVGNTVVNGTDQPLAAHFNGTSLSAVPTPTLSQGGNFYGVAAAASNDVWAVGYQNVGSSLNTLIEHWDGTSWSIVSSPQLPNGAYLQAVTAVSSTDVWAAGDINVSKEGVLIEHWDGTSWSVVSSPAFTGKGPIYGISADASNDVWAVGGNTSLHFDGTSWSRCARSVDRQHDCGHGALSNQCLGRGCWSRRHEEQLSSRDDRALGRHELEHRLQPEPSHERQQRPGVGRGRLRQRHLGHRF